MPENSKNSAINTSMDQHLVFLPYKVEWGRTTDTTNLYTQTSAGGDSFCLPIRNFISASPYSQSVIDTNIDNFIMLDSGLPSAFVHTLHFLGYTTPFTNAFFGGIDEQNKAYGITSDRQRRLVGLMCTHMDYCHVGGLWSLLRLATSTLDAPSSCDRKLAQLLDENFGYRSFIDDIAEWRTLSQRVLRSVEFCILPAHVGTAADIKSLFDTSAWSANHVTSACSSVSKEIFEKTCGQVLFVHPAIESAEHESKLYYWTRKEWGAEISPAVGRRKLTWEPDITKMLHNDAVSAPKHYPDTSEDNKQSLVICYIGFHEGEQIHYAFGGDSVEAVAAKARKRLPANEAAFADLLIEANVHTSGGVGEIPVDVFGCTAVATAARERIAEVVYRKTAREYTQEYIWDMFQLYKHGSIKNVLEYEEGVDANNPAHYIAAQVRDQLRNKARGFFVTSPGTRCHADPLILEALAQLALLSRNGAPLINVVHVAYPTIIPDGLHPAYAALDESGVLIQSFKTTSRPYRFAQPLLPRILEARSRVSALRRKIRTLMSTVLMPRDRSGNMSAYFKYASDQEVQGPMLLFYRILQLRRLHRLIDPMIFCLEGTSYVDDQELSLRVCQRVTAIVSAFMDACDDDIDIPDVFAGNSYSLHASAPADTRTLLEFLLLHLCLRYGALEKLHDAAETIGAMLHRAICELLRHAIENIWWALATRGLDARQIEELPCQAPSNDPTELLEVAMNLLKHTEREFRETATSKAFIEVLHSVFSRGEWPSLVVELKFVIFAISQLWKRITNNFEHAKKFKAAFQFYDISAYSDHAQAFSALKPILCEHGRRMMEADITRDPAGALTCLKRMAAALSAHAPEGGVCIYTAFRDCCYARNDDLQAVYPSPWIDGTDDELSFYTVLDIQFPFPVDPPLISVPNMFLQVFYQVESWHHSNHTKICLMLRREA